MTSRRRNYRRHVRVKSMMMRGREEVGEVLVEQSEQQRVHLIHLTGVGWTTKAWTVASSCCKSRLFTGSEFQKVQCRVIGKMDYAWPQQQFKYDSHLNFSTVAGAEDFNGQGKKIARDPMSHRIIEKRRRDRMNNCLADLSRLIPLNYMKKQGRGRIEKTEIIEMAIKHLKQLQQSHLHSKGPLTTSGSDVHHLCSSEEILMEQYQMGFQECLSETMHFMIEVEGYFPGDSICMRLINHLQKYSEQVVVKGLKTSSRTLNGCNLDRLGGNKPQSGHIMPDAGSYVSFDRMQTMRSENCRPRWASNAESAELQSPTDPKIINRPKSAPIEDHYDGTRNITVPGNEAVVKGHLEASSYGEEFGSQLREMLQSSTLRVQKLENSSQSSQSRPVSTASSSSSSSGCSTKGDEVYKFKTKINKRFKADQQIHHQPATEHSSDDGEDHESNTESVEDTHLSAATAALPLAADERKRVSPWCSEPGKRPVVPLRLQRKSDFIDRPMLSSNSAAENLDSHPFSNGKNSATLMRDVYFPPRLNSRPNDAEDQLFQGRQDDVAKKGPAPFTHGVELPQSKNFPGVTNVGKVSDSSSSPLREQRAGYSTKECLPVQCRPAAEKNGKTSNETQTEVPIFALHPKGNFYVPMSLDASLVIPRLACVTGVPSGLHHIGIAVCFYESSSTWSLPGQPQLAATGLKLMLNNKINSQPTSQNATWHSENGHS